MCVVGSRIGRMGLLKPLDYIMSSSVRHGAAGFVWPDGFGLCFALIIPQYAKILAFGMGLCTLCHCVLEIIF